MQEGTAPRVTTTRTKVPDLSIRHGTADQLARLSHFASLDLPEIGELDHVVYFLIGPVHCPSAVWRDLRPVAEHLYRLIEDDWDDRDLDDAREGDPVLTDHEIAARHERTCERLRAEIDNAIGFARLRYSELSRRAS